MADITHEERQVSGVDFNTAATLINGLTTIGTGNALDARAIGNGTAVNGFWAFHASGNSASADILVSVDSATWFSLTSVVTGINQTMTGRWSGYYPYIAAQVSWISNSGNNTATAYLKLALK